MIQIEKEDLITAIRFGLGSQGIWTPELEGVLFKEITQLAKDKHDVVSKSCETCRFNTDSWYEDHPCATCCGFDKHKNK